MSLLRNRLLLAVTLGHFTVDVYNGLLPVMYPLLVTRMGLSYTQVGLIVTASTIASSLPQPFFGHLADRYGHRLLAPVSVLWLPACIGLAGLAGSYPLVILCVFLAGLASAAYHPQGVMAAAMTSRERRGSAVSIFSLGGSAGYALGPLVGATTFAALGTSGAATLAPLGALAALVIYVALRGTPASGQPASHLPGLTRPGRAVLSAVTILALVIILRAWANQAITNYLPLLYQERGHSLLASSRLLFVLLLAEAVGGLIGGFLSDRVGRKPVVVIGLIGAAPFIWLVLFGQPQMTHLAAVPMGLLLGASFPVTVVMAQEFLPNNLGMASGLVMGLAFVTGGIGVAITGVMADHISLPSAMMVVGLLPVITALLALALPSAREQARLAQVA